MIPKLHTPCSGLGQSILLVRNTGIELETNRNIWLYFRAEFCRLWGDTALIGRLVDHRIDNINPTRI